MSAKRLWIDLRPGIYPRELVDKAPGGPVCVLGLSLETWDTGRIIQFLLCQTEMIPGPSRSSHCTREHRPQLPTSQCEGWLAVTLTPDVAKEAAHQEGWERTWDQVRLAKGTEWLRGKATGR
ncbi:unnamed protein product [Rangifer tarandus platyrhynchus]|uniref:Uncharacterized protein n=1 Tax=Rangifer tarandus platyrhynchus TaxID=3082113 RepID=A0AC59YXQ5_RANTA